MTNGREPVTIGFGGEKGDVGNVVVVVVIDLDHLQKVQTSIGNEEEKTLLTIGTNTDSSYSHWRSTSSGFREQADKLTGRGGIPNEI